MRAAAGFGSWTFQFHSRVPLFTGGRALLRRDRWAIRVSPVTGWTTSGSSSTRGTSTNDRRMFESILFGVQGTAMPSWIDYGLSQNEVGDLVNFIRSINVKPVLKSEAVKQ